MIGQASNLLLELPKTHNKNIRSGITSVCCSHPLVIEAALLEAAENGSVALIEATCNQVNQFGGYTGMTPVDYKEFVLEVAEKVDFPVEKIILGGDHLGPNPWRNESAGVAMEKARAMIKEYAAAGFTKLHLDASMSCAGDPDLLPPEIIANRAAQLAVAAEETIAELGLAAPVYIVGTEVPVPGGAAEELDTLEVTSSADTEETIEIHKQAFSALGLDDAFTRVVGLVVQPGVEFGHANVIHFEPSEASKLSNWRDSGQSIVFEAHSTDYQTASSLRALVVGGFAILKVGPGLTFAMREAIYGLDQIAGLLNDAYVSGALETAMEQLMVEDVGYWQDYYHGSDKEKRVQRHFSYSDRIRYYWSTEVAIHAMNALFAALEGSEIPETLVSQYLPRQYDEANGKLSTFEAKKLVLDAVRGALRPYSLAVA